MTNTSSAAEVCSEFAAIVDSISGTFIEASVGLGGIAHHWMQSARARWDALVATGQPLTPADFDQVIAFTGMRDGREVDHHVTKASDLVRRNSPGGANWYFLAHMCAVAMYGYWEDAFRTRLADALGVAKNDLKADEFGELKELRHAVLHNRARGNEKTARFATMPPIAERAPVEIEPQVLLDIAASAKAACERLARGHSRPWV